MTPLPSTTASLALDPATADETIATIIGALRSDPDFTPARLQTRRDAGVALIAALHPRNPVEAAFAVRAAAAHYGSVECFRRARQSDTPDAMALRWEGKGIALSRMNVEMSRELDRCQAKAPRAQALASAEAAVKAVLARAAAASVRPDAAPVAKPVGRQDPMPSERRSPPPVASAREQFEAALAARPVGGKHPMPSELPPPAPGSAIVMRAPGTADLLSEEFLAALAPRPGRRARLSGSTADVAAMLAGVDLPVKPHAR